MPINHSLFHWNRDLYDLTISIISKYGPIKNNVMVIEQKMNEVKRKVRKICRERIRTKIKTKFGIF